jgi:hypothetical protein
VSCSSSNAYLCDDFETGMNQLLWTYCQWIDQWCEPPVIDCTRAHAGNCSLRLPAHPLEGGADFSDSYIAHVADAGLPLTLYARAYFYITAPPPHSVSPPTLAGFFTLVGPSKWYQWAGPSIGITDMGAGTALQFNEWGASSNISSTTATAFPANQWVCVEWELTRASQTAAVGNVSVWQNGAQLFDLSQTGASVTNPGPPVLYVEQLVITNTLWGPAPTGYDVWVDDVLVDTSPVGCSP